ncbi:MAG: DUF1778 domain-containing protein [Opitutaceae bacterium]|nr:DUF1778 domain-containing protein [Opitutaceae bacterium]
MSNPARKKNLPRKTLLASDTGDTGHTLFTLKGKDWDEFNRLLDSPPKNLPALKKLTASAHVFRKSA